MSGKFTESKHPRLHGKFAAKLSGLKEGQSAHLPGGTKVRKTRGGFEVAVPKVDHGGGSTRHEKVGPTHGSALSAAKVALAHDRKQTQPKDSSTPPALAKMTPVARARHARGMERSAKTQQEKLKWKREAERWERQIRGGKK